MKKIVWVLGVAWLSVLTLGAQTAPTTLPTAQATAVKVGPWAFPLKPDRVFPEDKTPKKLEGSTKSYTEAQIDDLLNPPDWFPEKHPAAPEIVTKGRGDAMACGACHLMSGLGHPESSDLTGLSAEYMIQQMKDFKSGARIDPTRMNGIAKAVTDEEVRLAAEFFAALPRRAINKVVEQAMVPKTFLGNGRMRFLEPGNATEPIGNRIITVPDNQEKVRLRDPENTFTSYVPPGSLAKGKEIVETGGGKTISCTICHGNDLQGSGNIPRLAGMHPIYTVRQLHWFKDETRNGADAALMQPAAKPLTDEDIVAVSAYLASVSPQ